MGANGDFASLNLFAYCGNNPVSRTDSNGHFWHIIVGAIVGAATQYISDVATNLMNGDSFAEALKPTSSLVDYGAAALSGALAATGIGIGASIAANAAIGGAAYLTNCAINGEEANVADFGGATVAGALSGLIGGKGANGAKLRGIVKTSKQVLKTATSTKKIALYTAKLVSVKKCVVESTLRTMASGVASNGANYVRKTMTGSTY